MNPQLERGDNEPCLATWWHQATPGTTYWRCLVPARHLPGQTLPFTEPDLQEKDGTPFLPRQKGETAIWQFLGDPHRSRIALGMKEIHGTKTLMELDDNYLKSAPYLKRNPNAPWKDTAAEAEAAKTWYSHEMHKAVVPHMDGLIVSTEYLANAYEKYHDNIHICPNSVDPDDWDYEREEDDVFRIVYYGSPSHVVDAPIITKAMKWAAKQPGVEVWTAGFNNPSWTFPHRTILWTPDLVEARKNLFKFDVGVAPLKRNPWSNGKSDIKAIECAMAGVLPFMSRAEPFRPWFDHFPDLVLEDDDWEGAIRWAVKNPDLVKDRAADAKQWVLEHRSIHKTVENWRKALA